MPLARKKTRNYLPLVLLMLALFPIFGSSYYNELIGKIMIMTIFAMSLDLLVGFTGLVSFGHAAFFGVAAYSVVLLSPKYDPGNLLLVLPGAVFTGAAVAFVVGLFVLRTKGIYFIMVTLAFAQMIYFVFHDTPLGGGSDGAFLNVKPELRIGEKVLLDLNEPMQFYYVVLVLLVVAYVFLRVLLRSPLGHALAGIRSNEHRMLSLGFPVFLYKLAGFVTAGGIAGLAGFLSACQYGFVTPEILSWHQSGNVLLMVILGGMGTLNGAAIGAFAFVVLQEVFSALTKHWQLLMGVVIVTVVMVLPGGLSSLPARLKGLLIGGGNRNG
ncbi:amino acid/amide ABC transporter membrane protein 2, HAAT family [Aromatoleum tolulyticum]|uniref:Amino acid/amide ABC transporter membrane protein 2, HAAT family n=1 Tax=Aromatoleum tolulyticum TaxID=34027 RepID=A0A1N6PR75_9RHOO|nr:branched-chain amino acid ABC transporter permease [Aromatoleum tolulyticum]SIQ06821.1 amino acid/amide ABC transporter membrane protein 2, HAAT family [Aromatoleum tolulyticum]